MKKLLTLMLSFLMTMVAEAAEVEVNGLWYDLNNSTMTASVKPYKNDVKYSGEVYIPATIESGGETYTVTKIQSYAFFNCNTLSAVGIPKTMKTVGYRAFDNCNNMSTVFISDLEAWCGISFSEGGNPTTNGCHLILNGADVVNLVIPSSVKEIKSEAFSGCKYMLSVTIHDAVESIGNLAFYGCTGLSTLNIPDNVTNIGGWVCSGCTKIKTPVYNAHAFVYIPDGFTGSYTIADGITYVCEGAFANCEGLTSITFPNSLARIEKDAFVGCEGLKSVVIPEGVTTIGYSAFQSCDNLTTIDLPKGVTTIDDYAFSFCKSLKSIDIPLGLTKIGEYVLGDCTSLTSITIPNNITYIGEMAFMNCSALRQIVMGKGIERIGGNAFKNCGEVTDVYCYAPNPPLYSSSAFGNQYWVELATLHVPAESLSAYQSTAPWSQFGTATMLVDSDPKVPLYKCAMPTVTYADGTVKFECEMEGVEFVSDVTSVDAETKYTNDVPLTGRYTIKVRTRLPFYEDSDEQTYDIEWKQPAGQRGDVNGDGTVGIADIVAVTNVMAGKAASRMMSPKYVNRATKIQTEINGLCYELNMDNKTAKVVKRSDGTKYSGDIVIPSKVTYNDEIFTVTELATYLFMSSEITSVVIPETITTIAHDAFCYCSNLVSASMPSTLTSIGASAFYGCNSLLSIVIPEGVTSIGDYAFFNCKGATTLSIPNSLTSITGKYVFSGLESLTQLNIPNSITEIGEDAFSRMVKLTTLYVPNSVTKIGNSAFSACTKLETAVLGSGLKELSEYVFKSCYHLENVYCYAVEVPNAAEKAFGSWPEDINLHVPAGSLESYKATTPWSSFKSVVSITDDDPQVPNGQCATPIIHYNDGTLHYVCETPGVQFVTKVNSPDFATRSVKEFSLTGKYSIIVYASCKGMLDSNPAIYNFDWNKPLSLGADVNNDGQVGIADIVSITNIMAGKE